MSRTLNLLEQLLSRGRKLQDLGRSDDAASVLVRLAGLQELPAEVAEEAQIRLAELHLRRRRYSQARRHLAAALILRPDNARYHYLMGNALELDDNADPQRALEHYRRSLEIDPDQPRCLSDLGLLALEMGEDDEGIRALRQAVELAPDDADAVGKLAEGLCLLERFDEARLLLRAALFRNSRDYAFQRLWNDFQFQQSRQEQHSALELDLLRWDAIEQPRVLPFVRPPSDGEQNGSSRKIFRRDNASKPAKPHTSYPTPQSDRKHA